MTSDELNDFINVLSDFIINRNTKPIYIFDQNTSNNNFNIFVIDGKLSDPTSSSLVWNIQGLHEDWDIINQNNPVNTFNHTIYTFTINFIENNGEFNIDSVASSYSTISEGDYLTTNNYTTGAYTPTNDYNPATKKYVDDRTISSYITTLGDNINTSFTVIHNLNSENIIVQFRNSTTGEQLYIDNNIIDANTITVTTSTVFNINDLQVFILKI